MSLEQFWAFSWSSGFQPRFIQTSSYSYLTHVNLSYFLEGSSGLNSSLMISPVPEFGVESSQNAREKFRQKALKLLNGTVRDLTNLSTVGPKTAIVSVVRQRLNRAERSTRLVACSGVSTDISKFTLQSSSTTGFGAYNFDTIGLVEKTKIAARFDVLDGIEDEMMYLEHANHCGNNRIGVIVERPHLQGKECLTPTTAHENPRAVRERCHQVCWRINVWAGLIDCNIIGPYLLPEHLNGRSYTLLLSKNLPVLLEDIPYAIRYNMWFQHDCTPPHYSNESRQELNGQYPRWWRACILAPDVTRHESTGLLPLWLPQGAGVQGGSRERGRFHRSILNNIQFTKFEDLKDIPGLPKTYYERFVKHIGYVTKVSRSNLVISVATVPGGGGGGGDDDDDDVKETLNQCHGLICDEQYNQSQNHSDPVIEKVKGKEFGLQLDEATDNNKEPYSRDETSESNTGTTDLSYQELNCRQVSVSDGSDTVSFTQRSTVNSITRRSSRIAVYRKNEIQNSSIIPLTNTKRAARDSVRTIGTETSRLCSYSTFQDEQLICTSSLSNITTVRRSLRISRMRKDDAGRLSICSPSNVTTVRRSERLSLKLQTQDESRKMIPLQTSTVCRSLRPSSSSARHTDMTFKLSPSKVLAAGGRRRRSARLSGKPPAYSGTSYGVSYLNL
ncbi:hypothetical protein ANN_17412 [Periplaneta americana]|uniref:Uncharacterized protein n=1 Tax=Periplaneta americana TaxID=6978 RepID=A0ABQ8SSW3_PERAM|nr:hypothetical protein ANN_17412 [Periplaneta americana]